MPKSKDVIYLGYSPAVIKKTVKPEPCKFCGLDIGVQTICLRMAFRARKKDGSGYYYSVYYHPDCIHTLLDTKFQLRAEIKNEKTGGRRKLDIDLETYQQRRKLINRFNYLLKKCRDPEFHFPSPQFLPTLWEIHRLGTRIKSLGGELKQNKSAESRWQTWENKFDAGIVAKALTEDDWYPPELREPELKLVSADD